jgi:hypothetical protein
VAAVAMSSANPKALRKPCLSSRSNMPPPFTLGPLPLYEIWIAKAGRATRENLASLEAETEVEFQPTV